MSSRLAAEQNRLRGGQLPVRERRQAIGVAPVMKWRIAVASAVVAPVVICACGSQPPTNVAGALASPPPGVVSPLLARPVHLPRLSPGAACPTTPTSNIHMSISTPRGGPHFFLGGPDPQGGFAFNKTVYELIGVSGPVLMRGSRIDGSGTLMFAAPPADLRDTGEVMTQPGGETRAFYTAVLDPGAIQGNGSTAGVFYLYPATAGCYALQADGNGFEEIVVFPATLAPMAQ